MKRFYYHISSIENKENILKNGLIANEDGQIFLIDNFKVADTIAMHQLGLYDFSIFKINSTGFKCELINDNVAEFTRSSQFILEQDLIAPEFIKLKEDRNINPFDETLAYNLRIGNHIYENFDSLSLLDKYKHIRDNHSYSDKFTTYMENKVIKLEES